MSSGSVFCFGAFVLEPQSQTLRREDVTLTLEPKVYAVLHYLVQRQGELVDKRELLDAIWDDAVVSDNSLTRAVAQVRKVLDDDPRSPRFVATVHSRGYRFLAPVEICEAADAPAPMESIQSTVEPAAAPRALGLGGARRSMMALGVLGLGLAVAIVASGWFGSGADAPGAGDLPLILEPETSLDRRRIAVLPMADLTGDPEASHVADGFTEQLITALSRIDGVRVVPRTTVMAYRDQPKPVAQLGRELGVGTVLEGSLSGSGDAFRVTVRVIDPVDESGLWSKEVRCTLPEFFALQDEITARVAEIVEGHVSIEDLGRVTNTSAEQTEAFELYLRGRAAQQQGDRVGNEKAIEYFTMALERDPELALALAGLARGYGLRHVRFGDETRWLDSAAETAERALAIDPGLSQAHEALALAEFGHSRIRHALELSMKAIALDPGNHRAARNAAAYAYEIGRWDESLLITLRTGPRAARNPTMALRLWELGFDATSAELLDLLEADDPTSLQLRVVLTYLDYVSGRFEPARRRMGDLVATYQHLPMLRMMAGEIELRAGNDEQALELFEDAVEQSRRLPGSGLTDAEIRAAFLYRKLGRVEEAEQLLEPIAEHAEQAIKDGGEWPTEAWRLAQIGVIRGDHQEAVRWYQTAADLGHRKVSSDRGDPLFAPLRSDPGFLAIQAQVDAEIEAMRRRVRDEVGDHLERRPWAVLF